MGNKADNRAFPAGTHSPPSAPAPRRWRRRLLVGIPLLGAVALIGVPARANWRMQSIHGNESAAIATLKNISSAQAQLQASGALDANGNGAGEYGTFAQLAANGVLSAKFAPATPATTRVEIGGYVYEIVLSPAVIDRETLWACYAWPVGFGVTGRRAFFVNQGGDVLVTNNPGGRYQGDRAPAFGRSALLAPFGCAAPVAANTVDGEGITWVVV